MGFLSEKHQLAVKNLCGRRGGDQPLPATAINRRL